MTWTILLLLHLVGLVGYSLLLRKQAVARQLHPWVLATLLQTGIMLPMIIAAPFLPIDISRFTFGSIALSCAAVALSVIILFSITKALHYLEASTYSVVYNLRIVIATVLAALLLSEVPSVWQIAGGALVLAAIVIIRQRGSSAVAKQGIIWAVLAAVSISIMNVIEKQLIHDVGVFTGAPIITVTVGIVMWAVLLARRYELPRKYIFTKQIIGLMALRSLSNWAFIFALAAGALVSVATFVSAISVVLIVAFGALLLGERDYLRRKILAATLAGLGLATIIFG